MVGAEDLYPQREMRALAEAIREDGFSCEQIESAKPVGMTGDTVTIQVNCVEGTYWLTLWYNGSHSTREVSF